MDDLTRLILLFARTLISDRACWARGALARDQRGKPVPALDDAATSWCALGAIFRMANGNLEVFRCASDALEHATRGLYGVGIRAVNDSASPFAHPAVLGAFDHAIDSPIETCGWTSPLLVELGLSDETVPASRAPAPERVRRRAPRRHAARARQHVVASDHSNGG